MNTPVAAGAIVSVLPIATVNDAVDSVQKHSTLPTPAPVELRMIAYRTLFSAAPLAVNTSPAVVYLNLYCFAEVPTTHDPVAGSKLRPLAAYPPCAVISAAIDAAVDRVDRTRIEAEALVRCSCILKTPAPSVIVPLPM